PPLSPARTQLHPATLWAQLPCGRVVRQENLETARDVLLRAAVLDRRDELDAVIEVARHEIGAAEPVRRLAVRLEDADPAVLEEPPQHAAGADRLAEPRDTGPERADAARDDLHGRTLLGGRVQLVDDRRVVEVVHLDPDPCVLAVRGRPRDRADLLDQPGAYPGRRDQQLAKPLRPPEAGQEVEE